MDEVRLGSDGCGAQEVRNQMDAPQDLRNQILQLLRTKLSDKSIMVMQEELQFMQRSSYYLEVQRSDLVPAADQQQDTLQLSDSAVWSLIDRRRLQHAMTLANTQVKLLLALRGLLYQEITGSCRELEAFIFKYDQGAVDSATAASVQKKLQQTCKYVSDFERGASQVLGPLQLQNQLIRSTDDSQLPQLSVSLAMKMPVIFNRFKSRVTSTTAYLCWEVAGEQPEEPDQQFEVHVHNFDPNTHQHEQLSMTTCQSYNLQVNNLISDRYYQFSVKRTDGINLVCGLWCDTIILKTLGIF